MPRIAILLPPRERFSPSTAHAISLLARVMARPSGGGEAVVYGSAVHAPFSDVTFQAVALPWRPFSVSKRYAAGAVQAMATQKPDLIEVHDRPDLALYLARKLPNTPVMLFLHNDPQAMPDAQTPHERAFLLARLAAIAPVSDYLRQRLTDGVETRAVVQVFENFVDLTEIPKPAPQKCILFAGRVSADKGADSFVAACAKALRLLPGWRAEIIGADEPGWEGIDPVFLTKLKHDADAVNVALLGWRPNAEVLHSMAKAAIVVVPSREPEPFGLTALEAMACGAPLLCAPNGGLAEVMGAAALPINPDDPSMIAANIVALALDAPRRKALSQAGLAQAAAFSAVTALQRLAELRQGVLSAWPRH